MKKHILVTGGAGYIGSHTCKWIARTGYIPVTYDNLSLGHEYAVKWGPLIHADLRDSKKLNQALEEYKPIAVFHFASDALVLESMQNPGKYYDNNVGSTLSLLQAMRDHQIKHLVFSSSCATYGNATFTPINESHPQNPINPYGRSKWMIEQILQDFDLAHGIKSVSLRYFNAAGADLDGEIGEDHTPETHLIPSILHTALGLKETFSVYGTNFETPDGSAIRDYTHVVDLAYAHLLALQWLLTQNKSEVFNLGTGTGYSVLEILHAVEAFYEKKIPVHYEARRTGDPPILTADASRAQKILGWKAAHSDLKTLIASAAKWQEKMSLHRASDLGKRDKISHDIHLL